MMSDIDTLMDIAFLCAQEGNADRAKNIRRIMDSVTARIKELEAVYEAALEWRANGFAIDYGDKLCDAIAAVQTSEQNDDEN